MRIVYIGSVIFSAKVLEKLISMSAEIVGVITKKESNFNSDFFDLTTISNQNNIQSLYTKNINNEETINWIKSLKPDVVFCFGWSNLIKKEILEICPLGVIGYHPTLLPFNKGRHPLIWAKVLGLPYTGSSFFFMDEGADSGDILSQKKIEIDFKDDANTLYDKIINTALLQIEEFHSELKSNSYKTIPQNLNEGNNWRKRSAKDGIIDFRMNTKNIINLVRGLTHPYVGAHLVYNNLNITIWAAEKGSAQNISNLEAGKVLNIQDNSIEIKTGDSSIWLTKHEFDVFPEINSYIV